MKMKIDWTVLEQSLEEALELCLEYGIKLRTKGYFVEWFSLDKSDKVIESVNLLGAILVAEQIRNQNPASKYDIKSLSGGFSQVASSLNLISDAASVNLGIDVVISLANGWDVANSAANLYYQYGDAVYNLGKKLAEKYL